MSARRTTCPYCGVGCGVSAEISGEHVIRVMGDGSHPANAGRLCVKGTTLAETLAREGRLLHPMLAGHQVSWDRALGEVAERIASVRAQHGPGALAFYLSGQLLSEDYYIANKLMKGFLGSANVDTNSRLCMSSAVAAYKRAFGEDVVPCDYRDLETCDLLIMVGSNAAWTHPVVYQRIVAARQANPDMRVVVIDPRRTTTCDLADIHLQLSPGSDGFLFAGLFEFLRAGDYIDRAFVEAHTEGLERALAAVGDLVLSEVSFRTGLSLEQLLEFYELFATTERTVTLYSQGINQSATGTDKCNAIINCHLLTGRVGRPGMGPFSITGQPNAMGGREVGGLANQLAAHMDFTPQDVDRVGRFWGAKDMATAPGLKAVDMFRAAAEGKIRFMWILATNPAVSLPDTELVRRALERCEFVVVSDCSADTDTAAYADLLLPAAPWGEKDGTVTNSERCISRQRALQPLSGQARPDWWAITQVAHRLGHQAAFPYCSPADVFREHAALSAFENEGRRAFDIGALAHLDDENYSELPPTTWPARAGGGAVRPFADGHFFTPSGRARFVSVTPVMPEKSSSAEFDLVLNTGRLRDQWHTMTRTGLVPKLMRHREFFTVSVNPHDARARGLPEGSLVELRGETGRARALIELDDGVPSGQVFSPIHWSGQFSGEACISVLVPSITDPVSGQPQSKYASVALSAVNVAVWGQCFSREKMILPDALYWSRIVVEGGYLTLFAGESEAVADGLLRIDTDSATALSEYRDVSCGDHRVVAVREDTLQLAIFLHSQRDALPHREWMSALGRVERFADPARLLVGLDVGSSGSGRQVCSCWEVGERQILEAVSQGASSVKALGEELRCGTQCGSCIPELKELLVAQPRECASPSTPEFLYRLNIS